MQITVRPLGDTNPPEIYWTEPPSGAVGVVPVARPICADTSGPLYTSFVIVQFSEPVRATAVTPATIRMVDGNGVRVPVRVDYDGITRQATLSPHQPLQYTMRYTVTVEVSLARIGFCIAPNGTPQRSVADYERISDTDQVFRRTRGPWGVSSTM